MNNNFEAIFKTKLRISCKKYDKEYCAIVNITSTFTDTIDISICTSCDMRINYKFNMKNDESRSFFNDIVPSDHSCYYNKENYVGNMSFYSMISIMSKIYTKITLWMLSKRVDSFSIDILEKPTKERIVKGIVKEYMICIGNRNFSAMVQISHDVNESVNLVIYDTSISKFIYNKSTTMEKINVYGESFYILHELFNMYGKAYLEDLKEKEKVSIELKSITDEAHIIYES